MPASLRDCAVTFTRAALPVLKTKPITPCGLRPICQTSGYTPVSIAHRPRVLRASWRMNTENAREYPALSGLPVSRSHLVSHGLWLAFSSKLEICVSRYSLRASGCTVCGLVSKLLPSRFASGNVLQNPSFGRFIASPLK